MVSRVWRNATDAPVLLRIFRKQQGGKSIVGIITPGVTCCANMSFTANLKQYKSCKVNIRMFTVNERYFRGRPDASHPNRRGVVVDMSEWISCGSVLGGEFRADVDSLPRDLV